MQSGKRTPLISDCQFKANTFHYPPPELNSIIPHRLQAHSYWTATWKMLSSITFQRRCCGITYLQPAPYSVSVDLSICNNHAVKLFAVKLHTAASLRKYKLYGELKCTSPETHQMHQGLF